MILMNSCEDSSLDCLLLVEKALFLPQEHSYGMHISRVSTPRNKDARRQDVFHSLVRCSTISCAIPST